VKAGMHPDDENSGGGSNDDCSLIYMGTSTQIYYTIIYVHIYYGRHENSIWENQKNQNKTVKTII